MLTAVILAVDGDEERLGRTLASLVPGVLDGLVRDAIVVDGGRSAGLALVADHAGCGTAPDLAAGVAAAKGEWLLIVRAGARPQNGWGDAVREHLAGSRRPARFRASGGLLARLFRRAAPFGAGLLLRREEALAAGGTGLARMRAVPLEAGIEAR